MRGDGASVCKKSPVSLPPARACSSQLLTDGEGAGLARTQLLTFLEEFKDKMVRRTTEVTREVDELVYDVKVRRSWLHPPTAPRPA